MELDDTVGCMDYGRADRDDNRSTESARLLVVAVWRHRRSALDRGPLK